MIENQQFLLLIWALGGSALAQLFEYYYVRKRGLKYSIAKGLQVTGATGLVTVLYFTFVDQTSLPQSIVFHYGFFLALTIEVLVDAFLLPTKMGDSSARPAYAAGGSSAAGPLVVNGISAVFWIGSFGALITEFALIYRAHNSRVKSKRKLIRDRTPSDWALSVLFVVIGGGIVVMHGVTEINAITAMQLGAAGPLAGSRVR